MPVHNMQSRRWTRSIRVGFRYVGSSVQITSKLPVSTVPPPSDPLTVPGDRSGFWVVLEDEDHTPLYRRILANPLLKDREVFSADGAIRRVPRPEPSGTFFILLPDLAETRHIVLFSSPLSGLDSFGPAVELVRFQVQ